MFKSAALVVLGCVATARAAARNPCNETACSDPQCQWNTGTDQCEFKTKIGRECAKKERPVWWTCPKFCSYEKNGSYEYCKAPAAPFCENLPQQLCSDYGCTWQGNDTCKDDSTLTTPCDDPAACPDTQCRLNNGKCEFKTEIARLCAAVKDPNFFSCPNYCEAVRNEKLKYCKAKPDPTCDDLTPSTALCRDFKGCEWDNGDGTCKKGAKTPCDDPACLDSRCQLNNGKCEFKTLIARMCAATKIPSKRRCPDYCTYVHTTGPEGDYSFCASDSQPSCMYLPQELCEDPVYDCEWEGGNGCTKDIPAAVSWGLIVVAVTASILVLVMLIGLCCCCGWCCFAGQRSASGPVVVQQQPPVVTYPQPNYAPMNQGVPMPAIPMKEQPEPARDPKDTPPPAC